MPTKQTATISVQNTTDASVNMVVAHRLDGALSLPLTPQTSSGVVGFQYPDSTAYMRMGVNPSDSLTFSLDYEAGPGAGMDYWYVSVQLNGGRMPGLYTSGGTVLRPALSQKIPDSGQIDISVGQAPEFPTAPMLSIGATLGPGVQQGGMAEMTAVTGKPPGPVDPAVRRNVATLTAAERAQYVSAVKALKQAPSRFTPPTASRYDDYVLIHMLAMHVLVLADPTKRIDNTNIKAKPNDRQPMWAHESPVFLPWHREFLNQFERDLWRVSGQRIGIPYWDWSVNSAPNGVPWLDDFMGGDGHNGPVASGPFASSKWSISLDNENLGSDFSATLSRGFGLHVQDNGGKADHLPSRRDVTLTLAEGVYDEANWDSESTLASFRNQLEGFHLPVPAGPNDLQVGMHNLVHLWVAGTSGTMLWPSAPNDPVFFIHHANIDRLWALWQQTETTDTVPHVPMTPFYAPPDSGSAPTLKIGVGDQPMTFMDPAVSTAPVWADPPATPAQVTYHHDLNYYYDYEMPARLPSDTKRRSQMTKAFRR